MSNRDWKVEGLPRGAALLVVKRGPNAGSRFLLDRPVTSAGRHADNDIVLADITVSQHHAEFRRENRQFQVVGVDSSTAAMSTVNWSTRRCWPTVTRSRWASSV